VTERWLGGMLTNWSTIHQRIIELDRLEKLVATGEVERLTKKEGLLIQREINRLNIRLSGVRSMARLPDMLFVVDVSREYAAVHEANLLGVPVVALVDTNCDPTTVDYVIPSNDDAIRAIKLLVAKIADAVLEGKAMRKDEEVEAEAEALAAAQAEGMPADAAGRGVEMEVELEDDELLGEATLAKLTPPVKPAADEESEPEAKADTAEPKAEE
jgi:small subunit ribosomal protein S2